MTRSLALRHCAFFCSSVASRKDTTMSSSTPHHRGFFLGSSVKGL
jgi:hypothetical protein